MLPRQSSKQRFAIGALPTKRQRSIAGRAKDGVKTLQDCLKKLHAARYERRTSMFNIALAQGLAATGLPGEGTALIDETIRLVESNGDMLYGPELLRVKGRLLLATSRHQIDEAERCFIRSLELSRLQSALAWQLRTATDSAELWSSNGRLKGAREVLNPVVDKFTEGWHTHDFKTAKSLLETMV